MTYKYEKNKTYPLDSNFERHLPQHHPEYFKRVDDKWLCLENCSFTMEILKPPS